MRVTILRCKCHFEYEKLVYSGCCISDGNVNMMTEDTVKALLEHPCRITLVKAKKLDGLDSINQNDKEGVYREQDSILHQYEAYIANVQERLTTWKGERLESMRTKLKSLQQLLDELEETGDVRAIKLAQMHLDLAWEQYCNDSAEMENMVEQTIAQDKHKFSPKVIPEMIFTARWKAL